MDSNEVPIKRSEVMSSIFVGIVISFIPDIFQSHDSLSEANRYDLSTSSSVDLPASLVVPGLHEPAVVNLDDLVDLQVLGSRPNIGVVPWFEDMEQLHIVPPSCSREAILEHKHFLTTEQRTQAAQEALDALSMDPGDIDGKFGSLTCSAVIRWKEQQKMEVNGFIQNADQFCKLQKQADEVARWRQRRWPSLCLNLDRSVTE